MNNVLLIIIAELL